MRSIRNRAMTTTASVGVLTLVLTAALWGTTTTTQAGSAHAAASDPTFTIGMTNEVDSFNPFNGIEAESYEAWALMYDYMISWSPKDMSPEPNKGGLATSWDTSSDGLTWTFHIRDGVKWNDGVPLTAKDIAYTYNRILDGGPESASWGSYLNNVKTITAPDDTTVVMKLDKPNAVLPLLPMPILPEHVWKDVSEGDVKTYSNEPSGGKPVVGSGPFMLVEGKAGGSTYRFVRNPNYWGGEPNVSEVDMRIFRSEDTLVQALTVGEIDFAEDVSALQIKKLQSNSDIKAQEGDSPGFDEIAFNTGSVDTKTGKPLGDPNPAMLDPKFRFALNFAIDREQLASKAYQGAAQPAENIIPPAYQPYQWTPPSSDAYAYDPDKANQLLDEAGYKVGSDGWRTMPDGSPIGKLRLYARSDSETSQATMAFMKEWLNNVHIDSEVTAMESSKLTNVILDGEYDMFQWGWYVEPDPDSILSYFTCGQRGGWSDSWYCNKTYDKLYQEQGSSTDQGKREQIVKQMQQMLYDDMPYLVTVYTKIGEAYRSDRWTGFVPQPDPGGILLFQYGHANYLNLEPASASSGSGSSGSDGSGSSAGQVVLILVVALLVVGGIIVLVMMRRRASAGDRE